MSSRQQLKHYHTGCKGISILGIREDLVSLLRWLVEHSATATEVVQVGLLVLDSKAEVDDHHVHQVVSLSEHDVHGLYVAVYNVFGIVHEGQRTEHFLHDRCAVLLWQVPLVLTYVPSLVGINRFVAELHLHDENVREHLLLLAIVYIDNVLMVNLLQYAHLAYKRLCCTGIRFRDRSYFECHVHLPASMAHGQYNAEAARPLYFQHVV